MSTYWSLYVVPDSWKLKDCMAVGYMYDIHLMMSNKEFKRFMNFDRKVSTKLYDELVQQPAIHNYTSDDGGDPDYEKIMEELPVRGRLYSFSDRSYELVPNLKEFAKEHEGKRYICLN